MKNNLKAPADAMYPLRRSRPYLPNWALNCVPVASVSVLRVVKIHYHLCQWRHCEYFL